VTTSLDASIEAAVAASARLRGRPIRETATALDEAARRWRDDPELDRDLPGAADLTPEMVRVVLPLVAEALDADALVALHEREGRAGTPPALVAALIASNVPALAVPMIAHVCLAGAAVLIKSGRGDMLSAPAFRRALAAVDPALAATIVTTYWPGGSPDVEDAILPRADVVVATGADATIEAIGNRLGASVLAYGNRSSLAVVSRDPSDDELAGLAWDVARYEQRGCLSPHDVFVQGDPRKVMERLVAALDVVEHDVPMPPIATRARAAHRLAIEEVRFEGATVIASHGGTVVLDSQSRVAAPIGRRTVGVHALDRYAGLGDSFAAGTIECIGVGRDVSLDVDALRDRGVARICPVGRMQRPPIDWPRGQRPALAALFRVSSAPRIQVES
jgi:hypothetical protein